MRRAHPDGAYEKEWSPANAVEYEERCDDGDHLEDVHDARHVELQ
jgi:hypothetical protein